MDKRSLTETDIRTKFITPAIISAGWDIQKEQLQNDRKTEQPLISAIEEQALS